VTPTAGLLPLGRRAHPGWSLLSQAATLFLVALAWGPLAVYLLVRTSGPGLSEAEILFFNTVTPAILPRATIALLLATGIALPLFLATGYGFRWAPAGLVGLLALGYAGMAWFLWLVARSEGGNALLFALTARPF
jgi:hypothetical protein